MSLLSPQLEAFIAVAKNKTVHGAAAEIHLTQTAVTQRIRNIERTLKTTLFIRTRRGMRLTTEGEALLRYCHSCQILSTETMAIISGAGIATEINLSISAATSIMHSRVIPNCIEVLKQFPQLLLEFDVNDLNQNHSKLKSAETDFAIIDAEQLSAEMQYKLLQPEQYVLVASAKWKNKSLNSILKNERIIDYNSSDQITFAYLKKFDLFSLAKHHRHFVNRTDDLAILVAAGIGYTTLTKEFAKPYVENGELIILNTRKTYDITPVLAWYERPYEQKYFAAIIANIN
jgi:LysR family transcriptional regulator (chromosome initiation inhibitor)